MDPRHLTTGCGCATILVTARLVVKGHRQVCNTDDARRIIVDNAAYSADQQVNQYECILHENCDDDVTTVHCKCDQIRVELFASDDETAALIAWVVVNGQIPQLSYVRDVDGIPTFVDDSLEASGFAVAAMVVP